MVGGECRARQHAVERHAPQPLDGRRHRRRFIADGDDGGKLVERRRLDVGQDRQEIDAPEARRAGQQLGARAADDVGDLDGAVARVDRDGDGAQPRAGEVENRIGRHVGQPQRHPIARPDAEIGQALGGARRTVEQFGKAERPLAMDESRRAGRLLGDVGEQGPDVGGGAGKRHAARRLPEVLFISSVHASA